VYFFTLSLYNKDTMSIALDPTAIAKFGYEFLGKSIEQLAAENNLKASILQQAMESESWQRRVSPEALPDLEGNTLEEQAEKLRKSVTAQISIINSLCSLDNLAQVVALERSLLKEAQILAESGISDKPTAEIVRTIISAYTNLRSSNPLADTVAANQNEILKAIEKQGDAIKELSVTVSRAE
jgi:hypothetical protein